MVKLPVLEVSYTGYVLMSQIKKRIAVFFGGRSPEHDVSVVTGLQVLQAIDQSRFQAFPVYVAPDGKWYTGEILRKRESYLLDKSALDQVRQVTLDVTQMGKGALLPHKQGLFGGGKADEFDVAVLAFHGLVGEDGGFQGLFEVAGIPYTGMRGMASALLMDKAATKHLLKSLGIPALPCAVLRRPVEGYLIPRAELENLLKGIGFPCIIKPSHLGSSIGVAKADNMDEVLACLPGVFEYDDTAIVEPFVQNLVEYNVAVAQFSRETRTSAIEKPKTSSELLDFKQKYLSGGGSKSGGSKSPGQTSEGMLSLTRELNPKLDEKAESNIRRWALLLFEALGNSGAPRIDFIGNAKTGEVWMNEVNPIPGSFGYFLWEAAAKPVLFAELMTNLIDEALENARRRKLPKDPVPVDARLLRRYV